MIPGRENVIKLRAKIEDLKAELVICEEQLSDIEDACAHRWDAATYREAGETRRGDLCVPETWSRQCDACLKTQCSLKPFEDAR